MPREASPFPFGRVTSTGVTAAITAATAAVAVGPPNPAAADERTAAAHEDPPALTHATAMAVAIAAEVDLLGQATRPCDQGERLEWSQAGTWIGTGWRNRTEQGHKACERGSNCGLLHVPLPCAARATRAGVEPDHPSGWPSESSHKQLHKFRYRVIQPGYWTLTVTVCGLPEVAP